MKGFSSDINFVPSPEVTVQENDDVCFLMSLEFVFIKSTADHNNAHCISHCNNDDGSDEVEDLLLLTFTVHFSFV